MIASAPLAAVKHADFIIAENQIDLSKMDPADPKYDRLKLTHSRIEAIAKDIINVATLPYPVGFLLYVSVIDVVYHPSSISLAPSRFRCTRVADNTACEGTIW